MFVAAGGLYTYGTYPDIEGLSATGALDERPSPAPVTVGGVGRSVSPRRGRGEQTAADLSEASAERRSLPPGFKRK